MTLMQDFENAQVAKLSEGKEIPEFGPGDTLRVHVKVVEGERSRVQVFEGVCIGRSNAGLNSSFTVRKISYGEGVERVFPIYSPLVDKIEVGPPRPCPPGQALLSSRPHGKARPYRRKDGVHSGCGKRPGGCRGTCAGRAGDCRPARAEGAGREIIGVLQAVDARGSRHQLLRTALHRTGTNGQDAFR